MTSYRHKCKISRIEEGIDKLGCEIIVKPHNDTGRLKDDLDNNSNQINLFPS